MKIALTVHNQDGMIIGEHQATVAAVPRNDELLVHDDLAYIVTGILHIAGDNPLTAVHVRLKDE